MKRSKYFNNIIYFITLIPRSLANKTETRSDQIWFVQVIACQECERQRKSTIITWNKFSNGSHGTAITYVSLKYKYFCYRPFETLKWRISLHFHILQLKKSITFHIPENRQRFSRYPCQKEPAHAYTPSYGGIPTGIISCIKFYQQQNVVP